MSTRPLVGFVYNPHVPEAAEMIGSLVSSLGLQGSSWVSTAAEMDPGVETLAATSAIVTAGGDGTILRVVRVAAPYGVPIVGINMGRVGFMAELTVDEAQEGTRFYLEGEPRVEERMMLRASVFSGAEPEPRLAVEALNDVVARVSVVGLLDVDARVDGVFLTTYRADGVIAATPTGSTGYALSAGGPVMHPEARDILLQPVAAHISFQSGIIIPADSVVELSVTGNHEAILSTDGFIDASLAADDRVVIEKSRHVARFLRRAPPRAFYATLTQGLGVRGRQVRPAPGHGP